MVTHHTEHTFNSILSHIAPHILPPRLSYDPYGGTVGPLKGLYHEMRSIVIACSGGKLIQLCAVLTLPPLTPSADATPLTY